jgi:hypothetical protein
LPALTWLSSLTLLPGLSLLSALSLLPTLPLLPLLARQLLDLPLKLLSLALQHLLLPPLLEALGAVVPLTLRQVLLTTSQFIELLQRIVDVLRATIGR